MTAISRLQSNLSIGPKIGNGHFGEVHLATDDVHGDVAVKIFRQQPHETPEEWQKRKAALLAEGQRLSQATHENVVRVHQLLASSDDDAVHLVMELCRGGSLQAAFDTGPMCLSDVRRVATEISFGLQALHARGMLHRDIKPGNLLIDNRGIAKLGDFGLVTDNLVMGYGSAAGYSDHIAHEIWHGSPTSPRTDIWALGMTIYRLLHGAEWYSRSPEPRTIVPRGGFARTLRWLPHIPNKWRRFIRKALNDDPSSRYQNVSEVINALASLPTEPNWTCGVTGDQITWERVSGGRRIKVVLTEHSPRRHEWKAWSEPVSTGRSRTLESSGGIVSPSEAARQLNSFLCG